MLNFVQMTERNKSVFVVGHGKKKDKYFLNSGKIPNFTTANKDWMSPIIKEHPEFDPEAKQKLYQTLILTKTEANILRGIRKKEKEEATKAHPGGGFYMMLCILTAVGLRKPQPNRGEPLDKFPGFTSWDHLKVMQAKWKEETEKQAAHIGNRGPMARGPKGDKPKQRMLDARDQQSTPGTHREKAGVVRDLAEASSEGKEGAGGMAGVKGDAQFRNFSNPYAI